ncbi:MAG TPA: RNA polymerase sigma factor WhiG, partial [Spirochaetota bacterium]|nr:RNA polymerase sigma factor WhiG [Spirochaetota bacterium]
MANKKFQGFDATDEDELWNRYAKTQNQDIRDYFVIKYAPLVKYVAGKIAMGMPSSIEFDDLVSYGVFGLID